MFNKKSVQVEILKALFDSRRTVRKFQFDGKIAITYDGYCVFLFDDGDLFVDLSKLHDTACPVKDDSDKAVRVVDTNIRKVTLDAAVVKLASEDGKTVSYVQQSLMKRYTGCQFFSLGGESPIFCKDGIGNLVGFFLPLRNQNF